MAGLLYMADITLDRTGFDVVVNGIPAEHAMTTHRVRMPINEYLHPGANTIAIEPAIWGSNANPESPGKLRIKVTKDRVVDAETVSSEVLIEADIDFAVFPAGGTAIFTGDFPAEIGRPADLAELTAIGAAEEAIITDRLRVLSDALGRQDSALLLGALSNYFERYEAAYDYVERGEMAGSYTRMLEGMRQTGATVTFNPRLRIRRGGILVDCIGPNGAAIRAQAAGFPTYDLWLVMGVKNGEPVIVA